MPLFLSHVAVKIRELCSVYIVYGAKAPYREQSGYTWVIWITQWVSNGPQMHRATGSEQGAKIALKVRTTGAKLHGTPQWLVLK